ncbi:ADP-ribosylglycohydrolase [Aurantiacibacter gangjinensis]|nr:ADP-ribosylglycohydrolase [Aurantiacibacter gangjinensis]
MFGAGSVAGVGMVARTAPTFAASTPDTSTQDRIAAALYGLAIGDGMGAPVEGWKSRDIVARFGDHDFRQFLPPTDPQLVGTGRGKGEGRITDDGLLLEALIRAYEEKRDHLSAHDFADYFVPEYAERPVWIPERQDTMPSIERPLWFPERYSHRQLAIYRMEPRRAGYANRETQSYGGYTMPIGVVNAADPDRAYREAADFGLATQTSYGLEAGAVAAASFAAALAPDANVASVLDASLDLARDGTRDALHAVLPTVSASMSVYEMVATVREQYLPFSGVRLEDDEIEEADMQDAERSAYGEPSRIISIENPVAALAILKWSGGDFLSALRASVFYGEDCESIAAHVCGLIGALHGKRAIPDGLMTASDTVNRRDRREDAARLLAVARHIRSLDEHRMTARARALTG